MVAFDGVRYFERLRREKNSNREREEERKSETFCDNDNDDGGAKTNGNQRNPLKGQHTRVCVFACVRACVSESV